MTSHHCWLTLALIFDAGTAEEIKGEISRLEATLANVTAGDDEAAAAQAAPSGGFLQAPHTRSPSQGACKRHDWLDHVTRDGPTT